MILKLNKGTDADILQRLESVDNIQGYIKRAIRNYIKDEIKMNAKEKYDEDFAGSCFFVTNNLIQTCNSIKYGIFG